MKIFKFSSEYVLVNSIQGDENDFESNLFSFENSKKNHTFFVTKSFFNSKPYWFIELMITENLNSKIFRVFIDENITSNFDIFVNEFGDVILKSENSIFSIESESESEYSCIQIYTLNKNDKFELKFERLNSNLCILNYDLKGGYMYM